MVTDTTAAIEPEIDRAERQARLRNRKAGWWLLAAVVVCVGIAALTDLPVTASSSARRGDLSTFIGTIEGDIGQCSGGLSDAVTGRSQELAGRLAKSTVTTFIGQAIAVCSFTNAGIVDLGGVQPPRSLASLHLGALAPDANAWAYLYAFTTLQDLKVVMAEPSSRTAQAAYAREIRLLDAHRVVVEHLVTGAERHLGMPAKLLPLAVIAIPGA